MEKITIYLKSHPSPKVCETIEQELRDYLRKRGIDAVIENSITGNTVTTNNKEE